MNPKHVRWSVAVIAVIAIITLVQIPVRQMLAANDAPAPADAQKVQKVRQGLKGPGDTIKVPTPTNLRALPNAVPPLELKVAYSDLTVRVYDPKQVAGTENIEAGGIIFVIYPDTWQNLKIQHHWDGASEKGHNTFSLVYDETNGLPTVTAATIELNRFLIDGSTPKHASVTPRDDRVRFVKASDAKRLTIAHLDALGIRRARL